MDRRTAKSMVHVTLLVLLLEVTVWVHAQSLDLHHLRKGGCPPSTRFPSSIRVMVNMTRHEAHDLGRSLRSRSLSPWDYRMDVDNNRFPHQIAQAVCLHGSCEDSQGAIDFSMNSVPIRQEILVLRREMKGCLPVYRLDTQLVTVGCTCVHPVIREV